MTLTPEQLAKSRDEFEAFLAENFKMFNPVQNHITSSGEYYYGHVVLAWKAWQSRQESLVAELPAEIVVAIEVIRINVRSDRGVIYSGIRDNDEVRYALDMLLNYREKE